MSRRNTPLLLARIGLPLLAVSVAHAQTGGHDNLPDPIPPPIPKEATASDAPKYEAIIDDEPGAEWPAGELSPDQRGGDC